MYDWFFVLLKKHIIKHLAFFTRRLYFQSHIATSHLNTCHRILCALKKPTSDQSHKLHKFPTTPIYKSSETFLCQTDPKQFQAHIVCIATVQPFHARCVPCSRRMCCILGVPKLHVWACCRVDVVRSLE